jgi:hypothetical protein
MKYIFVAGAPGSKWSSVVKNIYYSASIDRSDYSDARTYSHTNAGKTEILHLGAYFDPGMEFELPESMSVLTRKQAENIFDQPFNGAGVRIIKSHIFSYKDNIDYLRELWPDCPVVLVQRPSDVCLQWWIKAGQFNISYPSYHKYYKDLTRAAHLIEQQNNGLINALANYPSQQVSNNQELADVLGISQPLTKYSQTYESDITVSVIQ